MGIWTVVFGFALGTSCGSFLNVVIDRLPREMSLVRPPSHCASCGRKLKPVELIPVVSYLWLKGRCRNCGAAIPRRIFAVELGTGVLFAFILARYGFGIDSLVLGLYTCLFLVLGVIDLECGIIPDKVVYPAAGVSLVLSPLWLSLGSRGMPFGGYSALPAFLNVVSGSAIFGGFFLLITLLSRGGRAGGMLRWQRWWGW